MNNNMSQEKKETLLPPPELPTSAIVSFLLTFKEKFFSTGLPGSYSK